MKRLDLRLQGLPWIDITAPTKEELSALAAETGLPLRPLMNCLDPEHLPKYEVLEDVVFVILRAVDPTPKKRADCVEDLTTKIAIFLTPQRVVTVHRLDLDFMQDARSKSDVAGFDVHELLRKVVTSTVMSFDEPINQLERDTSNLEEDVFAGRRSGKLLRAGYIVRRRAHAFLRVLQFTSDVISRLSSREESTWRDPADIRERAARLIFYADDLAENVTQLLSLHVALASQKTNEASYRTNEIVRVLTIFSIFFLPLNFIAGIYGMNFHYIPELNWEHGYFMVLILMAIVSTTIFIYLRSQGWLTRVDDPTAPSSSNGREALKRDRSVPKANDPPARAKSSPPEPAPRA